MKPFVYEVFRSEYVAQIGHVDQYGTPSSFKPYWTGTPSADRAAAQAELEAHEEVIQYNDKLYRYEMKKDYTRGHVQFRKIKVDEYEK
jgi:hypothetical protein